MKKKLGDGFDPLATFWQPYPRCPSGVVCCKRNGSTIPKGHTNQGTAVTTSAITLNIAPKPIRHFHNGRTLFMPSHPKHIIRTCCNPDCVYLH
ncbi:hypothetical protein TNCT_219121 [Trichonephila clavata]|uniref:Uncharacterized protein n=1 Tax=Trichonephila clavata TaxID=2740835 RepID=A0A8X6LCX5_TRICU|nr:hypothetical protein TNCT_219121 [Trichonephila clavata]